jgi:phospholipid/cholesterol/gamma-HCH transport system substrate-binding protein
MRRRDRTNLVKVGIFLTSLTIILMILIVSIGKENSIFDSRVEIKARVPHVSNLKPGSYVELKGIRVGAVSHIQILSEEEVEVTMEILEEQLKWIKQDSRVSISTAGLVGDKYVEIYDGTKEAPRFDPKKDTLISENLVDFKVIMNKGESIADVTDRILLKFDKILTKLEDGNKIFDTVNSINKTSKNLEEITKELKEAELAKTIKNLNKVSKSVDAVMTRIQNGPGTMNSLIFDDSLHGDLRALLGGAERNKVIKYYIRESIKNSERKKPYND